MRRFSRFSEGRKDGKRVKSRLKRPAAYSGAEDENRNADRIAQQEQELSRLIELRKALLGG
jgi:hypothetical protein